MSINEAQLKRSLHQAENRLDRATLDALADARQLALQQENRWFREYRGLFSSGLATAAVFVALIYPFSGQILNSGSPPIEQEEAVSLLMEDPEFYLWLAERGTLVAET